MRVLFTLLGKEIRHIVRNRLILPVLFIMPVVQMIILVYAASLDMKNIDMVVVDKSRSEASRRLISHFRGSPFFILKEDHTRFADAEHLLLADRADVVLTILPGFETELVTEGSSAVGLSVNAINATEAGIIQAYCNQIIFAFNQEMLGEWYGITPGSGAIDMDFSTAYWYNPELDYKIYMLSGILVILVTLIGMLLAAINLVIEKERGTSEQINVTPVKKYQFILAKLLPFLVIALTELAFGLVIGRILFDLPIRGSLFLLFGVAAVYLLLTLAFGLFLSTTSRTQQQMLFVAFFFMVTFILMSGIFTPVESMPEWARQLNLLNPLSYFMKAIRMILLKGSEFGDVSREFFSMLIYGIVMLTLSVVNYRKTSG